MIGTQRAKLDSPAASRKARIPAGRGRGRSLAVKTADRCAAILKAMRQPIVVRQRGMAAIDKTARTLPS